MRITITLIRISARKIKSQLWLTRPSINDKVLLGIEVMLITDKDEM